MPGPSNPHYHGRPVAIGTQARLLSWSGQSLDDLAADEKDDVLSMIGEVFAAEEIDQHGQPWINSHGKPWLPRKPG